MVRSWDKLFCPPSVVNKLYVLHKQLSLRKYTFTQKIFLNKLLYKVLEREE